MKRILCFHLLIVAVIIVLAPNEASASIFDWRVYESEYFTVFYPKGYEEQARETLYHLENNREWAMELTGNSRDFKTRVVVQDIGLLSNGYAQPITEKIGVFTNTPSTYNRVNGLENGESWLRTLAVHELVHISQLNNSSGFMGGMSRLFGNAFSPNLWTPMWMIEGIAVYAESQISPFEGRLNMPYYDAVIASRANAGQLPSLLEVEYKEDFYLYGAYLINYLSNEYGEEMLAQFFKSHGYNEWGPFGSLFPEIGIDKSANMIYGKTFVELYDEWREYEEERHKDWELSGDVIVRSNVGRIRNLVYFDNNLYYFKSNISSPKSFGTGWITSLVEYDLNSGKEKIIKEFNAGTNGKLQVIDGKVYYSLLNLEKGFANTDYSGMGVVADLYSYDLESGRAERVLRGEFKDFIVLEDGDIIYVKDTKSRFGSEIWRYSKGDKEYLGSLDQMLSEIEVYEDQFIVVSKENMKSWNLNHLELDKLELGPIVESNYTEKSIKVEGQNLYFTSSYGGAYGIYRYDLASEELFKVSVGPYATDGLVAGEDLYYVGIDSSGEKIYRDSVNEVAYSFTPSYYGDEYSFELALDVEEGGAFGKNMSYLLKPHTRTPFSLMGEDALGLNSYYLTYLGDVNFSFSSRMLTPLTINYYTFVDENEDDEKEREHNIDLNYPLYQSLSKGLSYVDLTYSTDFNDSIPGLYFGFSYPRDSIGMGMSYNIDDESASLLGVYEHRFDSSSIRVDTAFDYNTNDYLEVRRFELPREEEGNVYSIGLNYNHKLRKVRDGWWNPNIFVGDLYGNLFVDYAGDGDKNLGAYGYELIFELYALSGMATSRSNARIGFSKALDAELEDNTDLYFIIDLIGF